MKTWKKPQRKRRASRRRDLAAEYQRHLGSIMPSPWSLEGRPRVILRDPDGNKAYDTYGPRFSRNKVRRGPRWSAQQALAWAQARVLPDGSRYGHE